MRKPLGTYGPHGSRVRVWVDGALVRVEYRDGGARRTRSWPNTAANRTAARAWAAVFAAERSAAPTARRRWTTAELWAGYAEAEMGHLRPRSVILYRNHWHAWQTFVTPQSHAEDLGVLTVGQFRADREQAGWAPSTTAKAITVVKIVYAWAYRARLLERNEVRDYRFKVAKEARHGAPAEYRTADWQAIVAQLPLEGRAWRAGAVLRLCGLQGARQNAVLHLQWEDVDLAAQTITWQAAWDKTGTRRVQPLRPAARVVFEAVRAHHAAEGLTSPWLFPGRRAREVYSAQSLWAALVRAEREAGIPHQPRRAAHGFRRMLFGNVLEATHDLGAAMDVLGDTDLRVVSRSYRKSRLDQQRHALELLDAQDGPRDTTTRATKWQREGNLTPTQGPRRDATEHRNT